jgi:hypothetical protein
MDIITVKFKKGAKIDAKQQENGTGLNDLAQSYECSNHLFRKITYRPST